MGAFALSRIAEFLRSLGFADAAICGPGRPEGPSVVGSEVAAVVDTGSEPTPAWSVQMIYGLAAIEGKIAMSVSLPGHSAEAAAWADRAGVARFGFAEEPTPENEAAAELVARALSSKGQWEARLSELRDARVLFGVLHRASDGSGYWWRWEPPSGAFHLDLGHPDLGSPGLLPDTRDAPWTLWSRHFGWKEWPLGGEAPDEAPWIIDLRRGHLGADTVIQTPAAAGELLARLYDPLGLVPGRFDVIAIGDDFRGGPIAIADGGDLEWVLELAGAHPTRIVPDWRGAEFARRELEWTTSGLLRRDEEMELPSVAVRRDGDGLHLEAQMPEAVIAQVSTVAEPKGLGAAVARRMTAPPRPAWTLERQAGGWPEWSARAEDARRAAVLVEDLFSACKIEPRELAVTIDTMAR